MARSILLSISVALLVSSGASIKSDSSKKHHKHHHKHHQHSHSELNATAEFETSSLQQEADKKDGYVVRMFEHIQKTLADAWKHKDRLDSLQKTVKAEQHLLMEQQQLLEASTDEDSTAGARNQVEQTSKMIKQAKELIQSSKNVAVQSAQKSAAEAKFLKKQAEKDFANSDAIIAQAMEAKDKAQRRMAQAETAIQGAEEEAKFFAAKYGDVDTGNSKKDADDEDAAVTAPPAVQAAPSTTAPKMQKETAPKIQEEAAETGLQKQDKHVKPASLLTIEKFQQIANIDLRKGLLPAETNLALLKEAEKVLEEKSRNKVGQ